VVTAGKLLAETVLGTDCFFQAFPDYGPGRMGAPTRAFIRLSPRLITIHAQIEQPDVVLVLDPTLLGILAVTEGLAVLSRFQHPGGCRARKDDRL
jgi:pyruvate ferredoxin oxidoreductase gamma subunit